MSCSCSTRRAPGTAMPLSSSLRTAARSMMRRLASTHSWPKISPKDTPVKLLQKMVQGDELLQSVRLIEGWTFRQVRAALAAAPHLKQQGAALAETDLMAALGLPGVPAEGRFFPDTYLYSRGVSDLTVLKRAAAAQTRRLAEVWAARAPNLPLQTPEQALADAMRGADVFIGVSAPGVASVGAAGEMMPVNLACALPQFLIDMSTSIVPRAPTTLNSRPAW